MDLSTLAHRAAKFTIDNSPTILTSLAVAGSLTAAYLTGRATWQAATIIRNKQDRDARLGLTVADPKQEMRDRLRMVAPLYIPPVAMCIATTVCIIGANRIGTRRAAASLAAFTITERAFEEYRGKVTEKFGVRKEEGVRTDIIQDRVNVTDDSVEVHGLPRGQKCYDKFSDRYLWSTQEELDAAVNELNRAVVGVGYATLADLYYILDMPAPGYSHEIGWNSNDQNMKLRFTSVLTPGGEPVLAFEFDTEPTRSYLRFH